jgi:hypothetical protein
MRRLLKLKLRRKAASTINLTTHLLTPYYLRAWHGNFLVGTLMRYSPRFLCFCVFFPSRLSYRIVGMYVCARVFVSFILQGSLVQYSPVQSSLVFSTVISPNRFSFSYSLSVSTYASCSENYCFFTYPCAVPQPLFVWLSLSLGGCNIKNSTKAKEKLAICAMKSLANDRSYLECRCYRSAK